MSHERVLEWLTTQMKRMKARSTKGDGEGRPVFVTLSRQAGAGGLLVAKSLAELLTASGLGRSNARWIVLDRTLIERLIRDRVLHEQYMKHVETRVVKVLDQRLTRVHTRHRPSTPEVARTNRTILHLAAMGNIVIVGGANLVTEGIPGGLRIRLVGSESRRVRAVRDYYGLGEESARKFVKKEDFGRSAYVKLNFDRAVGDALRYDLVANSDDIDPPILARVLMEALRVREGLAQPVPDLASA